jgi:hypothetical protein
MDELDFFEANAISLEFESTHFVLFPFFILLDVSNLHSKVCTKKQYFLFRLIATTFSHFHFLLVASFWKLKTFVRGVAGF